MSQWPQSCVWITAMWTTSVSFFCICNLTQKKNAETEKESQSHLSQRYTFNLELERKRCQFLLSQFSVPLVQRRNIVSVIILTKQFCFSMFQFQVTLWHDSKEWVNGNPEKMEIFDFSAENMSERFYSARLCWFFEKCQFPYWMFDEWTLKLKIVLSSLVPGIQVYIIYRTLIFTEKLMQTMFLSPNICDKFKNAHICLQFQWTSSHCFGEKWFWENSNFECQSL